jgi:hypothetical protein
MSGRYMTKPTYVDVLKYVEGDRSDVFVFTVNRAEFIVPRNTNQMALYVTTDLGPKRTHPGDYIVKDSQGKLTVHRPEEFEEKYIKVKSHAGEK